jgi:hypothetical protein
MHALSHLDAVTDRTRSASANPDIPRPAHPQPRKKFVPGKRTHNSFQINKTAPAPNAEQSPGLRRPLSPPHTPETAPPASNAEQSPRLRRPLSPPPNPETAPAPNAEQSPGLRRTLSPPPSPKTTPPTPNPAHPQPRENFVPGKRTHNSFQINKTAPAPEAEHAPRLRRPLSPPPTSDTTPPTPNPAHPQPRENFVPGKRTHNSPVFNKEVSSIQRSAIQEATPEP